MPGKLFAKREGHRAKVDAPDFGFPMRPYCDSMRWPRSRGCGTRGL